MCSLQIISRGYIVPYIDTWAMAAKLLSYMKHILYIMLTKYSSAACHKSGPLHNRWNLIALGTVTSYTCRGSQKVTTRQSTYLTAQQTMHWPRNCPQNCPLDKTSTLGAHFSRVCIASSSERVVTQQDFNHYIPQVSLFWCDENSDDSDTIPQIINTSGPMSRHHFNCTDFTI